MTSMIFLDVQEADRLVRTINEAKRLTVERALEEVAGSDLDEYTVATIVAECSFDHAAILLFPDNIADVVGMLREHGFDVAEPIHSVVVRERIALRHGIAEDQLDISILRASIALDSGTTREVEIFCLPRAQATETMITREQAKNEEKHFALKVRIPNAAKLSVLRSILIEGLAMRPDGGGYNPNDDAEAGGRSVLYFRIPGGGRLELTCAGNFTDIITVHRRSTHEAPRDLLNMLTGNWRARAIHTAARLGIADILSGGPLPAEDVARLLDADPDATARFLRFMSHIGVFRVDSSLRYGLDAIGELLRIDNPFHDLVRLYGEEFHQAWDNLLPAIKSGDSAFALTFGVEHFDYMAAQPELARRFDRSMAATTQLIADSINSIYDFSTTSTVVDIGGGNGELLRAVLRANQGIRGVLADRNHVVASVVVEPDLSDRLTSCPVDFFDKVPAGHDVYLLVRVLHDWNNDDCIRILRVCREACGPAAAVLIVERLLPDRDGDSLAIPWDMQMLAITGGRERTTTEYAKLLSEAGFVLSDVQALPLDMKLLSCLPIKPGPE